MSHPLISRHLDRRGFLRLAGGGTAGLLAASVLSGCGSGGTSAGSGSGGGLSVSSPGGSFTEFHERFINAPFTQAHGTQVATTISNSATLSAKIRAGGGSAGVDVAYIQRPYTDQLVAEGLVRPLDFSKMPNAAKLADFAVDPAKYWAATFYNLVGIAYRTDKVSTPPTSWADLADPQWAGHLAVADVSNTAGFLLLIQLARMNGGSESQIDPGFTAMKALRSNIASFYTTGAQLGQMLTSQEDIWLGPYYRDQALSLKAKGAPIDFVIPDEGGLVDESAVCVPTGSTAGDLAEQYLDYAIGTEAETAFCTAATLLPSNTEVKIEGVTTGLGSDAFGKPIVVDFTKVASDLPGWVDRFHAEITQ